METGNRTTAIAPATSHAIVEATPTNTRATGNTIAKATPSNAKEMINVVQEMIAQEMIAQ